MLKFRKSSKGKQKDGALPRTSSQAQAQRLDTVLEEAPEANPSHEPIARGKYLILPEGLVDWDKWSPDEREELDDYVRHLLHSRKWKLRRTWRGFKQYFMTRKSKLFYCIDGRLLILVF